MSLDNFQMTIGLATELYKDSLVALDTPQIKSDSLKPENLRFLGNNEKHILIIVKDPASLHLNDTDTALLTGILNACKLNFNDVALFNQSGNKETDFKILQEQFSPGHVLLFGVQPSTLSLPIEFAPYVAKELNKIIFLSASSLQTIGSKVEEKKQLWNALKNIFSI